MRAAVLEATEKPFVVRDVPTPPLLPNGVILRVEANGICRSDWHVWKGDWSWVGIIPQLPMVIGHEFCGVVEEVGADVTRWKKGDRVIVPFSGGEGACEWCRTGHHNVCDTPIIPGLVYGGGYGRYSSVPYADVNLVRLPEHVVEERHETWAKREVALLERGGEPDRQAQAPSGAPLDNPRDSVGPFSEDS